MRLPNNINLSLLPGDTKLRIGPATTSHQLKQVDSACHINMDIHTYFISVDRRPLLFSSTPSQNYCVCIPDTLLRRDVDVMSSKLG
jgi:hypothetical protein